MTSENIQFGLIESKKIIINKNELAQRLHCPSELALLQAEPFRDQLYSHINCKYSTRISKVSHMASSAVDCGFGTIQSESLSQYLLKYKLCAVFAVTLGFEIDRELAKLSLSPADAFIFDALASAAVESAADYIQELTTNKTAPFKRFSAGYGDFDLSYQKPLLEYLNAQKLLGVALSESMLMKPSKTITAIVGIE